MRATIKKWGNSAAVRIPASVMSEARLSIDQTIEIHAEDDRIVIEPASALDLDSLLAGVTEENLHREAGFGRPVGKEAL